MALKRQLNNVRKNTVMRNAASLSLLQAANFLVPLLILPYIVRILGVEIIGKVTYAQNIVIYLTLIINYGFEYSATRDITLNRENKQVIREIFWGVIRQKTLLLLLSALLLLILYFTFSKVHDDPRLYLYIFLMNIGVVLFPTWFFQGMERMTGMAVTNFCIKLLGLLFTVLLVRSSQDYLYYPFILSLTYIAGGLVAFIYVVRKYDLGSPFFSNSRMKYIFQKGTPIFLNNVFVTCYTAANLTILGFYASDMELGYYSGAHRIISAVLLLTGVPINMSLFPVISRKFAVSPEEGWRFFRKVFLK